MGIIIEMILIAILDYLSQTKALPNIDCPHILKKELYKKYTPQKA